MAGPAARTQVGIIGGGPAGLLLSQLLHRAGIESVVLERASRAHCEERVRAGVLEPGSTDVLEAAGVGERMRREGLVHHGIELRFAGARHRIALSELAGRPITVYGQQEVVKDRSCAARGRRRPPLRSQDIHQAWTAHHPPSTRHAGAPGALACDWIAGCDGSHGGAAARSLPGP